MENTPRKERVCPSLLVPISCLVAGCVGLVWMVPALVLSLSAGRLVRLVARLGRRVVRFGEIRRVFEARYAGYRRVRVSFDRPARLADLLEVWELAAS